MEKYENDIGAKDLEIQGIKRQMNSSAKITTSSSQYELEAQVKLIPSKMKRQQCNFKSKTYMYFFDIIL